jgi:hypothetical protein
MAHIELSDMIVGLRKELQKAQAKAEKEDLKFKVDGIEIEAQVTVSKEATVEGGVKWNFWIFSEAEGKAGAGISKETVQTIRLKLTPAGPAGSVQIAGEIEKPTR